MFYLNFSTQILTKRKKNMPLKKKRIVVASSTRTGNGKALCGNGNRDGDGARKAEIKKCGPKMEKCSVPLIRTGKGGELKWGLFSLA